MSKDMEEICECRKDIKTIVFPRSVRRIGKKAFNECSLISVVTCEKLEALKGDESEVDGLIRINSPFRHSKINEIWVKPGLRHLRKLAFAEVSSL